MITAVMEVIVLFSAYAFAGADMCLPVTNVPTLSEWETVGTVVVLGVVDLFFLIRIKKHGCCS